MPNGAVNDEIFQLANFFNKFVKKSGKCQTHTRTTCLHKDSASAAGLAFGPRIRQCFAQAAATAQAATLTRTTRS